MAARTDLARLAAAALPLASGLALCLAAAPRDVVASPSDEEILGADDGWKIESVDLLTAFFDQDGLGYQSQAGPVGGPGSEEAWILEPWLEVVIRQSARVRHEVTIPVDVVSAASPDALDAVSTASRLNESAGFEVRSAIDVSEADRLTTRAAFHWEEPLSSGTLGAGWQRSVADDNATIAVTGNLTVDGFDMRDQQGDKIRQSARETTNANLTVSQLLSPTTVIDGSYGVTWQHGTLAQTWNAVPVAGAGATREVFPRDRLRHALTGRIAQHVPPTRSTIKVWYRYYRDDFGLSAHTVDVTGYQYLVPWLYLRGGYRFHRQSAVDFYTDAMDHLPVVGEPRTADSDLARFDAHELSLGAVLLPDGAPRALRRFSIIAEVGRYHRTNDLTMNIVTVGLGRRF
ncbi:MAG TPA: DUF3570 domain-containing protein [Kofleriaceae bacterium]|nr:DUF3570 domain-containing protein [Kofleriaceae bacterium]